jgi:hypothetical protein
MDCCFSFVLSVLRRYTDSDFHFLNNVMFCGTYITHHLLQRWQGLTKYNALFFPQQNINMHFFLQNDKVMFYLKWHVNGNTGQYNNKGNVRKFCLSSLKLRVWIPIMGRCTRSYIMWSSFSVTRWFYIWCRWSRIGQSFDLDNFSL